MRGLLLRTAFVLLLGLGWSESARAEADAGKIIGDFGLFGTWALDCSRPASASNDYHVFLPGQPYPQRILKRGEAGEYRFDIKDVRRIGTNWLAFIDHRRGAGPEGTFDVIIERVGNRFRTISSVAPNGRVVIRNGRLVKTGEPTLRFERCTPAPEKPPIGEGI
jgi:hypothetical protein